MHEQKFKDLLSSKCPVNVERRVLVLESEVHQGPGLNGGWIILFSHSKASDVNVGIIANFVYYGKIRMIRQKRIGLEDSLHSKL